MPKVLLLMLATATLSSCQSSKPPPATSARDLPVTFTLSKVGGGFLRMTDEFELAVHNRSSKPVCISGEDLFLYVGVSLYGRWDEIPRLPPPVPDMSEKRFHFIKPYETETSRFRMNYIVMEDILRWRNYVRLQAMIRYWPDTTKPPLWITSNSVCVEE